MCVVLFCLSLPRSIAENMLPLVSLDHGIFWPLLHRMGHHSRLWVYVGISTVVPRLLQATSLGCVKNPFFSLEPLPRSVPPWRCGSSFSLWVQSLDLFLAHLSKLKYIFSLVFLPFLHIRMGVRGAHPLTEARPTLFFLFQMRKTESCGWGWNIAKLTDLLTGTAQTRI